MSLRACALAMLLLAVAALPARAQISPGPLARAHASLEGATNCARCHGLHKEPMTQMCLACHREVQWLLDQKRGFHARERAAGRRECASCHPDHAGADFALIAWPSGTPAKFDHARAGLSLDGKHARAKCESCHKPSLRRAPVADLSPRKTGAGWMGLETECVSCHLADDVHKKSLGASCDRCHDANDWKKASRFDHARTDYPLAGEHEKVACDKCHRAAKLGLRADSAGKVQARFKPLPFKECSDCHADPHKGRLSAKCGECHSTRGFKVIDKGDFDHARTRYALKGRHRSVSCDACHGKNMARPQPAFGRCADCHMDVHAGGGTILGKPATCEQCHTVDGFAPATYTVALHAAAPFPLAGRHIAVKCSACHTSRDSVLRVTPRTVMRRVELHPAATCGTCHVDAHGGELRESASRGACKACHTDAGWAPSSFGVTAHAATRFAIDGRHADITCVACHAPDRVGAPASASKVPKPKLTLRLADRSCESCHVDPHAGRYRAGGPRSRAEGCVGCHDTRHFRPAVMPSATHAALGFALDGAHRAVPCVACHKDFAARAASSTLTRAPRGVTSLPFTAAARTACSTCHDDPHGGQFALRPAGGTCDRCHDTAQWLGAARFVHDRDSAFPLAGEHRRVPCAGCHRAVPGATRIQYRPLATSCESCHANDATKRKKP